MPSRDSVGATAECVGGEAVPGGGLEVATGDPVASRAWAICVPGVAR